MDFADRGTLRAVSGSPTTPPEGPVLVEVAHDPRTYLPALPHTLIFRAM